MDKITAFVLLFLIMAGSALAAPNLEPWQPHISEASARFGMPENWLRSVIAVESNGDPKAVSSKGAMGLMQLMPETWKNLRAAYDLGADPFDPKANILAGTAYLRVMYDRFGYPGLFAAYNAGEACYEEHLRTGNPLPEETLAYVADLGKRLGFDPEVSMKVGSRDGLFFRLSSVESSGGNAENSVPANGLFVRISTGKAVER